MSLEPCKVCGTLNAADAEICLSCGHPTDGKKRPTVFRIVAIALVVCFALPFLSGVINWIVLQLKPETPAPERLNSLLYTKEASLKTKSSPNRANY